MKFSELEGVKWSKERVILYFLKPPLFVVVCNYYLFIH